MNDRTVHTDSNDRADRADRADRQWQIAANDLQVNVLGSYDDACCARVAFLRFDDEVKARAWVAACHRLCFHEAAALNVAFSYSGLVALGCGPVELRDFPAAFRDGMAARAQRLGDPPGSEALAPPWRAGSANGAAPWQPGALHALAILYLAQRDVPVGVTSLLRQLGSDAHGKRVQLEPMARAASAIAVELDAAWSNLHLPDAGVEVLGTQDLHHPLIEQRLEQQLERRLEQQPRFVPVEYFGFRDGVSQPALHHGDRRLDHDALQQFVLRSEHPLMTKGSFLVLRQLQQEPAHFWQQLGDSSALAEQLVGRAMDGSDLPAAVGGCPFHSHARRANPGLDTGANPRLLRRGMSYTHEGKCGLMFMALNADIETQFEFIQRNWLQRGNHVGLLSSHRDPLAGLSGSNDPTPFLAVDADGKQGLRAFEACVSLKWGEYFFLPSHAGLQRLAGKAADPVAGFLAAAPDAAHKDELVAHWLDDAHTARAFWEHVRNEGGVAQVGTRVFVGDVGAINALCPVRERAALSVTQYRERMAESTGPFMLGMDAETASYVREHRAVAIIPTEPAELVVVVKTAAGAASALCKGKVEQVPPGSAVPVELKELLAFVLSQVLGRCFGLPGPGAASLLTWSNDIARLHFRVAPSAADHANAQLAAAEFRTYIGHAIAAARKLHGSKEGAPGTSAYTLYAKVEHIKAAIRQDADASDEDAARILLGIATGSLTAVATLFKETFVPYAQKHPDHVLVWPEKPDPATPFWLYDAIVRKMALEVGRGGPDAVVRTYRGVSRELNRVQLKEHDQVVVWLGGANQQANNQREPATLDDAYLFGMNDGHRCPGITMGKAILQGLLEALMLLPGLRLAGESLVFDQGEWG